jgi:phosphomannomutase
MPDQSISIERLDGLGMEFDEWRFNLRLSNTEPGRATQRGVSRR